jgi:hypothetical protein
LGDLNFDLEQAGLLPKDNATGESKPYKSWSDVSFALAAIFKYDGRHSNEQIATALMADLDCNQHVQRQPNKRRTIERLILRSHAPPPGKVRTAGSPNWREQRKDGSPLPSMHNARLAITALGIECSYDKFHNKLLFGFKDDGVRHAVEHIVGEVTDNGIIALRQMPVIRSTLASWRKLPFWVRLSPKIANFNQGRLCFLRADAFRTRSRKSSKVRLSVVKLLAAKSEKNVTWTLWSPMSSSAATGSPLGGLGLCAFTGTPL